MAELAIFVIVLLLVADQVVQCEAVMTSDKVDAARGSLARGQVQIRASTNSACERCSHARVATPEAAHIVTETAVPFRPPIGGEISHLISAASVPCFRDDLYITKNGILGNAFEKWSDAQNVAMLIPAEDGSEVEPKPVDVHMHDPVAKNTRHELSYHGVVGVQRIAHAGKVFVVPALVLLQHIE